jgi:hypothetical protein
MSQCELVNREKFNARLGHMSSFNLKQQEIGVEEVHRNLLPSSLYKHGIIYEKDGGERRSKNRRPGCLALDMLVALALKSNQLTCGD